MFDIINLIVERIYTKLYFGEIMKKRILFIIPLLIVLIGVSYAFYNYSRIGEDNNEILSGQIYMRYNDTNTLYLTNVFPETKEEALAEGRTDNEIRFTINGKNTNETRSIYYEIDLNLGDEVSGKNRIRPEDVMIHLECDGEVLVDAVSYSKWNEERLWAETIPANTLTESSKSYVLKAWVSEDVFISDSNPNADYTAQDWNNSYISLKLSVYGDFVEKSVPFNYMVNLSDVTAITDQKANISEVHFISLTPAEINTRVNASTINADVTDTSLSGSVKAWLETDTNDTTKYIMYVASEGTTYLPSNSSNMFANFSSVTNFNFENVSSVNVTDMQFMFAGCSQLTNINLSMLDMSNVTNASSMLRSCPNLTSVNIDNWDLTSLANMYNLGNMFTDCSSLTSLSIDGWILDDTIGFVSILYGSGITSLELTNFDLSESTTIVSMFANCSSITSLSISEWYTSNIINMASLFAGCSKLTSVDLSGLNTINVNNMNGIFQSCSNLTSLDLSNFITTNVTDMGNMFNGCSSLTSLDLSAFNTNNVTSMLGMFSNCKGLSNLNISSFTFDSVTALGGMFYNMLDTAIITVGGTSQQDWVLALSNPHRPTAWTTENVIIKN